MNTSFFFVIQNDALTAGADLAESQVGANPSLLD
jgi:hypothetical protein